MLDWFIFVMSIIACVSMSRVIEIDVEKVENRKVFRKEALLMLYNFYFENRGKEAIIGFEDTEEGIEKRLAHLYLAELGLITAKPAREFKLEAKITAYGIDAVENEVK